MILLTAGTLYVVKVDMPMGMMPTRLGLWKLSLRDTMAHPITGWGLDSFRTRTEWKPHVYAINATRVGDNVHVDLWDNPHSLYVSLPFEWGWISILLLIGYLRQLVIWFQKSEKEPNTIALMGFMVSLMIVNAAQFPMFLARSACYIVPMAAIYEIQTRSKWKNKGEKHIGFMKRMGLKILNVIGKWLSCHCGKKTIIAK